MKNQTTSWLKKPYFLISLLLATFILKGLVFVAIIPIFQGSDEYIHYATVQHLAEPEEKNWAIKNQTRSTEDTKDIPGYHYTQEIRELSSLTKSWEMSGQPHNTQDFNQDEVKRVENEISSGKYLPYIDYSSPDVVTGTQLSHKIGSFIEKTLSQKNIFYRYFAIRILAIFYGLVTVLCAYYIAIWSGMKKRHSFLLAGIIAFQPMFTATTAIINYDPLLIALSSIFLLASVSILTRGLNLKNISALIVSTALATMTKGIGGILIVLALGLIAWALREKFPRLKKINLFAIIGAGILLVIILSFFAPNNYLTVFTEFDKSNSMDVPALESIGDYLNDHVFDMGKYERTSVTYWGTFGWLDTQLHETVMSIIRAIQYISIFGLLLLLLSRWKDSKTFKKISSIFLRAKNRLPKKIRSIASYELGYLFEKKDFLPQKKVLIFFAISIVLLQAAVRFYDWRGIFTNGEGVGTPGRYFFPNIIPHFMFVTTGFGVLSKSSRAFGIFLKILLILMILLCLYSIFLIIIPRYYL